MKSTALQLQKTVTRRASSINNQAPIEKRTGKNEKMIVTTALVKETELNSATITIVHNSIAWFDWG